MKKTINTATHLRHGESNQKIERTITMKKTILKRVSGMLSIILALAMVAVTFIGVSSYSEFSGLDNVKWHYTGQSTKYTGNPTIYCGDQITFTGTIGCNNKILSATVGIYHALDEYGYGTQPVKNSAGNDKVVTKEINSTSLDVYTGLDQRLDYSTLAAGTYYWCVTATVEQLRACDDTIVSVKYTPVVKVITVTAKTTSSVPVIGSTNSYIEKDKTASASWGTATNGVRIYMAEHGSYNVSNTKYDANFLVYKDKKLIAVFTGCSTLPDLPKAWHTDFGKYCATVKDGEYSFDYDGSFLSDYCWRITTTSGSGTLPCIRWNGSNSFVSSTCSGILIHKGGTKKTTPSKTSDGKDKADGAWSAGCLTINGGTGNFYKSEYVGRASGTIKIVRDTPVK